MEFDKKITTFLEHNICLIFGEAVGGQRNTEKF